jgi:hypothetical protein
MMRRNAIAQVLQQQRARLKRARWHSSVGLGYFFFSVPSPSTLPLPIRPAAGSQHAVTGERAGQSRHAIPDRPAYRRRQSTRA